MRGSVQTERICGSIFIVLGTGSPLLPRKCCLRPTLQHGEAALGISTLHQCIETEPGIEACRLVAAATGRVPLALRWSCASPSNAAGAVHSRNGCVAGL